MKSHRILVFAPMLLGCFTCTLHADDFYIAPMGDDRNDGSIEHPFASLQRAQENVSPGDTVFIRGGTYLMTQSEIAKQERIWAHVIRLDKSGTEGKRINYWAYENEQPVFDFSSVRPRGRRVHAFSVSGSWIHLRGIEVVGVQVTIPTHTQSICFANDGSHNIYERLNMHDGMAIGIYSVRGSDNLFLNCDAFNNYDSFSENGRGGNTDGFGCHPTKGGSGNVFRGCRAWFNSDDGFDCINASETVTFENCWAFNNGYSTDFKGLADGNGFKIGGYGSKRPSQLPYPIPRHAVKSCLAVHNRSNGFYANHHVGGSNWLGNSAFRNGTNFNMLSRTFDNARDIPGYDHVMRGNLSYGSRRLVDNLNNKQNELFDNSFDFDSTMQDSDFLSLDESQLTQRRQPDGTLPDITFLQLRKTPDHFTLSNSLATSGKSEVRLTAHPYHDQPGFGLEAGSHLIQLNSGNWTSDKPFHFSVKVPEGNYRVTVTLGDQAESSCTTIKAELRRLMLENIRTLPGETVTRNFIVNVRTPIITDGQRVRLKAPRETVDEAWAWDERLTLEFNGEKPIVQAIIIEPVDVPTVFLLGDSTVCDQSREPYASWGQMLPRFLKADVAVANHAESGESLSSSERAGRLDKVLAETRPGDYVLIQFGHNDMKSKRPNASETYRDTLRDWVRCIKTKGAKPVLITPMHRHRFDGNSVVNSLKNYPDQVRQVARDEVVPLVDLNLMSKQLYEKFGPDESARLFKHDFDGDPKFDRTHHSAFGAYELAKCVLFGLRHAKVELADHVVREARQFDPSEPDSYDDFAVPASPGRPLERPPGD